VQSIESRAIQAAGALLEVRPLRADEAHLVVDYFHDASDEDLARMGVVDRKNLPPAEAWDTKLRDTIASPLATASSFYFAWLVDGQLVGFSSLKNLRVDDRADLHLHMWSAPHRRQGHGATLFCLTVLEAFERFHLQTLVCEPKASNPMPNRMLAKVGFPLVRTYVGASSELSKTVPLNQYDIRRDIAETYLGRLQPA
jgi:RimJ/RimL family protein N-acetyltransferase